MTHYCVQASKDGIIESVLYKFIILIVKNTEEIDFFPLSDFLFFIF